MWLRLQDLQGEGVRQRGAERVQGRGGHAVQVTRVKGSTCPGQHVSCVTRAVQEGREHRVQGGGGQAVQDRAEERVQARAEEGGSHV